MRLIPVCAVAAAVLWPSGPSAAKAPNLKCQSTSTLAVQRKGQLVTHTCMTLGAGGKRHARAKASWLAGKPHGNWFRTLDESRLDTQSFAAGDRHGRQSVWKGKKRVVSCYRAGVLVWKRKGKKAGACRVGPPVGHVGQITGIGIMMALQGDGRGVVITHVFRGSQAAKAGVRAGERIHQIGSKTVDKVRTVTDVVNVIGAQKGTFPLHLSNGRTLRTVKLRRGPIDSAAHHPRWKADQRVLAAFEKGLWKRHTQWSKPGAKWPSIASLKKELGGPSKPHGPVLNGAAKLKGASLEGVELVFQAAYKGRVPLVGWMGRPADNLVAHVGPPMRSQPSGKGRLLRWQRADIAYDVTTRAGKVSGVRMKRVVQRIKPWQLLATLGKPPNSDHVKYLTRKLGAPKRGKTYIEWRGRGLSLHIKGGIVQRLMLEASVDLAGWLEQRPAPFQGTSWRSRVRAVRTRRVGKMDLVTYPKTGRISPSAQIAGNRVFTFEFTWLRQRPTGRKPTPPRRTGSVVGKLRTPKDVLHRCILDAGKAARRLGYSKYRAGGTHYSGAHAKLPSGSGPLLVVGLSAGPARHNLKVVIGPAKPGRGVNRLRSTSQVGGCAQSIFKMGGRLQARAEVWGSLEYPPKSPYAVVIYQKP